MYVALLGDLSDSYQLAIRNDMKSCRLGRFIAERYFVFRFNKNKYERLISQHMEAFLYPWIDLRHLNEGSPVSGEQINATCTAERDLALEQLLREEGYWSLSADDGSVVTDFLNKALQWLEDSSGSSSTEEYGKHMMAYLMWRQFLEPTDLNDIGESDRRFVTVLDTEVEKALELMDNYNVSLKGQDDGEDSTTRVMSLCERFLPFPCTFSSDGEIDTQLSPMAIIMLSNDELQETLSNALEYYSKLYSVQEDDRLKKVCVRSYIDVYRLRALAAGLKVSSKEALDTFNEKLPESEGRIENSPVVTSGRLGYNYKKWVDSLYALAEMQQ